MSAPSRTRPPTEPDQDRRELAALRRPSKATILGAVVIVGLIIASGVASEVSPTAIANGIPNIVDFLGRMFPPDFSALDVAIELMIETLGIAIFGTAIGALFAVPLGLLAARTVYPESWIHHPMRLLINVIRAVPELIWALLFVSAVGLGPLAGTLAIAIGSAAGMGRLFGDIFEAADPRAWQAAGATGASRPQKISWVLLPEQLPSLASYTLLLLDSNIRAASLLGLVGAGGIGMELNQKLRLFEYGQVLTIVLVVLVVVVGLDQLSSYLRRRLT